MKKTVAALAIVFIGLAATTVLAKRSETVKVLINKEVTAKSGLKVAFVELVEDSRCPEDAQCVWAGNAKIKIRVTKKGKSEILELNTMPNGDAPSFAGYRFSLTDLMPRLRSNVRINRNAYEASIEMKKEN